MKDFMPTAPERSVHTILTISEISEFLEVGRDDVIVLWKTGALLRTHYSEDRKATEARSTTVLDLIYYCLWSGQFTETILPSDACVWVDVLSISQDFGCLLTSDLGKDVIRIVQVARFAGINEEPERLATISLNIILAASMIFELIHGNETL